jgi:hypothetical protein
MKDRTLEEDPIPTGQEAAPVGTDTSSYLRRPIRTLVKAQQDCVLNRRRFAETKARAQRLGEMISPGTLLRLGREP